MSIDAKRLGVATAKAMDELDRLHANGEIAGDAEIGAVVIIVALDQTTPDDYPDRENTRDVMTQCFCFSEPEHYYIQLGLIELAKQNYTPGDSE